MPKDMTEGGNQPQTSEEERNITFSEGLRALARMSIGYATA
jgi:hypothetical protein